LSCTAVNSARARRRTSRPNLFDMEYRRARNDRPRGGERPSTLPLRTRTDACGPWPAAASGPRGRSWFASAPGTHGCAGDGGDSVGTCASCHSRPGARAPWRNSNRSGRLKTLSMDEALPRPVLHQCGAVRLSSPGACGRFAGSPRSHRGAASFPHLWKNLWKSAAPCDRHL
jgi:hypothetical protein